MVKEPLTEEQYEKLYNFVVAPSQKYKTPMTEKRFREALDSVVTGARWAYFLANANSPLGEFGEIVGQAVFSGKQIIFKEEDEMKVTADEINRKFTTAAMLDEAEAEIEESPFPIPFGELPEEPEWDRERQLGPPPPQEDEEMEVSFNDG